ncbi:hypothetical protein M9H77_25308 [Catharanthus roseus]|uniref:Uncharacterized protein n=1 Tax=Catharanthus roseus TaxID=4058 RepID=A0ACC0A6K2_CATRO|nr:hypothetical protein M9H77_25308 [Catharanthus roseus]
MKKKMMQGNNTVEEVICLSAQRGYTIFYRNCDESKVLSDIVVAYPTSIQMMRTCGYQIYIDCLSYSINKVQYAIVGGRRDDSNRYGSTCHDNLDTVFLNIGSIIEGQIVEIKKSLEYSMLKQKYNTKSNMILKNISNNISHLASKKILLELKRAPEIIDDLKNKRELYFRTSHGVPCSCKYLLFLDGTRNWGCHSLSQETDMDAEMHIQSLGDTPSCEGGFKSDFALRSFYRRMTQDRLNKKGQVILGARIHSHRKIQKSSEFGSGSRSGSSLGSHGRGRLPRSPIGRGRGCSSGRSSLSSPVSIIDPFIGSTFPFPDAFPCFVYPFIKNWKNVEGDSGYRMDWTRDCCTRYARAYLAGDPIHVNL